VSNARDVTFEAALEGTGATSGLAKQGAGTLTLAGTNTYQGATRVAAGNLAVTGLLGGGAYAGSTDIAAGARLTFDTASAQTVSGAITGAGTLAKAGGQTLTLSGANTYTGETRVEGGTLRLEGAGTVSPALTLYGGAALDAAAASQPPAIGTLTVMNVAPGTPARYAGNLSAQGATLNFHVPAGMGDGGVMLAVSGTASVGQSQANVGIDGASTALAQGGKIVLIEAASLAGLPANAQTNGLLSGMQGVTLDLTFGIEATPTQLLAVLGQYGARPSDQSKALSEGAVSGLAFLAQGSDLAARQGVRAAYDAALHGRDAFGVIEGGSLKYKTGSSVRVTGVSSLAGAAARAGKVTAGAFFEWGDGRADTYNRLASRSVKGKDSLRYYGLGALGQWGEADGFHAEGSLRAGRASNEFSSGDFLAAGAPSRASYTLRTHYYSAHAGAGYAQALGRGALDLYGQALYTRQGGGTARLPSGESLKFSPAESKRLRLGLRYAYDIVPGVRPYAGLAWEHESGGKAKVASNGRALEAARLKGSSASGELGIGVTPQAARDLSFEAGVTAHAGRREGVAASARVTYRW
jgi:outer membrane autotransporter protein